MSGCYYVNVWGQTFAWTQTLPTIVTSGLSLLTLVTHAVVFFVYGLFLHGCQFVLWAFQLYFQYARPDPICQLYNSYGFPSVEAFYAASLASFVISFSLAFGVILSWIVWIMLYILAIAPPLVLVWFSYNTPWEVLFSMGMGALFTIPFVIVFKFYITPIMPYLLTIFPLNILGYNGAYYLNQHDLRRYAKIHKCLRDIDAVLGSDPPISHSARLP